MVNRINQLFATKSEKILSIYFCAGHPTLEGTAETIKTLEKKGVDMIEVGIPFSDPMADGPVIQNAATKALRNGMSLKKLFSQLEELHRSPLLTSPKGEENHPDSTSSPQSKEPCPNGKSSPLGGTRGGLPLILMGYLNPIMQFGFEAFCKRCTEVGVDGVIIPDLPFKDYLEEYKPIADKYDIRIIMLITPETSDERIRFIDEHTDGFIYMVSSAATTGAQKEFGDKKQAYFSRINSMNLKHPRMIGFGISNKQTLESAQANAAGAIIGSKFVNLIEETQDAAQAMDALLDALKK
jgi:tryptophan synthase alpha chain